MVGKLIGITAATLLALRLRVGELPAEVGRHSIVGVAALSGIGFTVSLFIAPLAYESQALIDGAKIGILAGSVTATVLGATLLALHRGTPRE